MRLDGKRAACSVVGSNSSNDDNTNDRTTMKGNDDMSARVGSEADFELFFPRTPTTAFNTWLWDAAFEKRYSSIPKGARRVKGNMDYNGEDNTEQWSYLCKWEGGSL